MKPKIFIGSTKESIHIAHAIQYNLREIAECKVWDQTGFTIAENALASFISKLDNYDFAILIFTGEDLLESRGSTYQSPRDNIIFELGLFTAALGANRTIIFYDKKAKPKIPTDLHGITFAEFEIHSDNDVTAGVGTACYPIKEVIHSLGRRNNLLNELQEKVTKLQKEISELREEIPGKRLYQHRGYYPIEIQPINNIPILKTELYEKALTHFVNDTYDKLAAMDLVYLREDNIDGQGDVLKTDDQMLLYERLIKKYELEDFVENFTEEKNYLFQNLKKIIHDIGDTLKGCNIEILLHNIRNPIRSIVALRNTDEISGRKKYDPSTRFVVQFVKDQGRRFTQGMNEGSKIAYPKQFNKNKKVKATTIPIMHPRYGLIAILCINIDKDKIQNFTAEEKERFFNNYTQTFGETPDYEKDDWGVK